MYVYVVRSRLPAVARRLCRIYNVVVLISAAEPHFIPATVMAADEWTHMHICVIFIYVVVWVHMDCCGCVLKRIVGLASY